MSLNGVLESSIDDLKILLNTFDDLVSDHRTVVDEGYVEHIVDARNGLKKVVVSCEQALVDLS